MTIDELPELVTPAEAQAYLRIGRNRIYWLISSGQLPAVNLGQRQLRIPRQALAALVGVPISESAPLEPVTAAT